MLIADFLRRRNAAAVARLEGSRRVAKTAREMGDTATAMPRGNDPAVVALWWQLLEVRQAALADALAVRADVAADDPLAAALADVDAARSALNQGIATDRTLRIGPPSPSEDQLSYSAAVIRERATRLRDSAANLERVLEPTSRG